MSETPLVDTAVLDDLVDHIGDEAARAIVELCFGEYRELVGSMAAAAATPGAARRAAHSLKSSAGQIGAAALSEAALAVEAAEAADLPARIAELAECAAQTETALAARLG